MGQERMPVQQHERTSDHTPKAANQSSIGDFLKSYVPDSVAGMAGLDSKDRSVMAEGDSMLGKLTSQMLSKYLVEYGLSSLLAFADRKALDMLRSYETFATVSDQLQKFTNALSLAMSIWGSLPAPVRTGILFLTGKVMHALPKGMFGMMEGYIVDADKDVKDTYVVYAVEKLTLAVQMMSNPVSSVIGVGKYLYSYFWSAPDSADKQGPDGESEQPGAKEALGEELANGGSLAKIDLHIIWLEVKGLHLEKTEEQVGENNKEGGLHADFALGARMLGEQYSLGEKQRLTLIFPWSGGAILESEGAVSILEHVVFGNLFEVSKLDMTELKASNQGIETAAFTLSELSVFNDTITATNLTAAYTKSNGLIFAGDVALSLLKWKASSHLDLELDAQGNFKSGKLQSFHESTETFTVKEASLDRETGFQLKEAEINLQRLINLDMSAFVDQLSISNNAMAGEGGIRTNGDIGIFEGGDNHLTLTHFEGRISLNEQQTSMSATAGIAIKFDGVNAGGDFAISYDSKDGRTTFVLNNAYFSAEYPGFTATAKEISYDHQARQFRMARASASIASLGIDGEVHDLVIDGTGVQFSQIRVTGPEEVTLIDGLTLKGLALQVEKSDAGYTLRANAGADIKIATPNISGKVENMELELSKESFQAKVDALSLEASWFKLAVKETAINKAGFSAAEAELWITGGKGNTEDAGFPGLNTGLFDFLPVNQLGVQLSGIGLSAKGFTVTSFKPMIPPLHFKALGIEGNVDFEKMYAQLAGSKTFSLADMLPGVPLSVSMIFPVLPGLEVYGSLGAEAAFTLSLGMEAQNQEGLWGISGSAGFKGHVGLRVELGAQLGSQAVLALAAGAFAEGGAKLNAEAAISGKTRFDREQKRFKREAPLIVSYNLAADAIAKVGIVIKAKAFYVFEKKLYEWTAAEWVLGTYRVQGQLGEEDNAEIDSKSPENRLGLDEGKAKPAPVREIRGKELDELLRSDEYISGSGEVRKEILQKEHEIKRKWIADLLVRKNDATKDFDRARAKYMVLMEKKNAYFMQLWEGDDAGTNTKLREFNEKHQLDRIWDKLDAHGQNLERIGLSMAHALDSLDRIIKLEAGEMERGMGSTLKTMDDIEKINLPDVQELDVLLNEAETSLQDYSVNTEKPVSIFTASQFISLTTTKKLGVWTTDRKSIQVIDRALDAYHGAPGRDTLDRLAGAIEQYGNKQNMRMPAVLLLKENVEKLQQQMGR